MGIEYPAPEQACYGSIDQAKYGALIAKLKGDPNATNLVSIAPPDEFLPGKSDSVTTNFSGTQTGSVTYQAVDFAWSYDGISKLTVTIVAKRSWKAKIAGNQAIFQALFDDLIGTV